MMKSKLLLLCAAAFLCQFAQAEKPEAGVHRYLYLTSPDGAQQDARSGKAILVFDIDDGHKFVKRIDMPIFVEGLRGFTGSAETSCLYYSTTAQTLGCFNVESEKIVWQKKYNRGCDRSSITPDGKTIYVPTGWWYRGKDSGFLVIDAATGELVKRITVNKAAHNSITSLDGRFVYLGTETTLTQFDAGNGTPVRTVHPVGESGVFPFTIDSANRFAYVCLGKHVGFDLVDLKTGEVPHRVFAGNGDPIPNRTHGIALTPDESEIWISDQKGRKLFIFDATSSPPSPKSHVNLSMGGHGWITFSLDGAYAWCHTPDVFDARTKKQVATLKDEHGNPVASSKFIEVHMRGGKVVRMGNEFGLGRKEHR